MGVKKQIIKDLRRENEILKNQIETIRQDFKKVKKRYNAATGGFAEIVQNKVDIITYWKEMTDKLLSQVEPLEKNSNKLFNELQQCKLEKSRYKSKYLAQRKDNKAMAKVLSRLP